MKQNENGKFRKKNRKFRNENENFFDKTKRKLKFFLCWYANFLLMSKFLNEFTNTDENFYESGTEHLDEIHFVHGFILKKRSFSLKFI